MFVFVFVLLFFVKQKTAYEMRISDWSSDVCSSDLWVLPVLSALDSSIHLIGNVLIECADDVAAVESYFVATLRARTPHGWTETIRNGRSLDAFRRRNGDRKSVV